MSLYVSSKDPLDGRKNASIVLLVCQWKQRKHEFSRLCFRQPFVLHMGSFTRSHWLGHHNNENKKKTIEFMGHMFCNRSHPLSPSIFWHIYDVEPASPVTEVMMYLLIQQPTGSGVACSRHYMEDTSLACTAHKSLNGSNRNFVDLNVIWTVNILEGWFIFVFALFSWNEPTQKKNDDFIFSWCIFLFCLCAKKAHVLIPWLGNYFILSYKCITLHHRVYRAYSVQHALNVCVRLAQH